MFPDSGSVNDQEELLLDEVLICLDEMTASEPVSPETEFKDLLE